EPTFAAVPPSALMSQPALAVAMTASSWPTLTASVALMPAATPVITLLPALMPAVVTLGPPVMTRPVEPSITLAPTATPSVFIRVLPVRTLSTTRSGSSVISSTAAPSLPVCSTLMLLSPWKSTLPPSPISAGLVPSVTVHSCASAVDPNPASASSGATTAANRVLRSTVEVPAPWTAPALSLLANSGATTNWPSSLFQTLLWILFMCGGLLGMPDARCHTSRAAMFCGCSRIPRGFQQLASSSDGSGRDVMGDQAIP